MDKQPRARKYCILDFPCFKQFSETYLTNTPYCLVYSSYEKTVLQKISDVNFRHSLESIVKSNVDKDSSSMFGHSIKVIVIETKGDLNKSKSGIKNELLVDNSIHFYNLLDFQTYANEHEIANSTMTLFLYIPSKMWEEQKGMLSETPYSKNITFYNLHSIGETPVTEFVKRFTDVRSISYSDWINISFLDILAKVANFDNDVRYAWMLHLIVPKVRIYKLTEIQKILIHKGFNLVPTHKPIALPVLTKYATSTLIVDASHCPVFSDRSDDDIIPVRKNKRPVGVTFSLNELITFSPFVNLTITHRSAMPSTGLVNEQTANIMSTIDSVKHRLSLAYYYAMACPYQLLDTKPAPDFYMDSDVFLMRIWRPRFNFTNPFIILSSPKGSGKSSYSKLFTDDGHKICDSDFYGYILFHYAIDKPLDIVPYMLEKYNYFHSERGGSLESGIEILASQFLTSQMEIMKVDVPQLLLKSAISILNGTSTSAPGNLRTLVTSFRQVYNQYTMSLMNFQDYTNNLAVMSGLLNIPTDKKFLLFVHNDYETNFALGNTVINIVPLLQPLITLCLRAGKRDTSFWTDLFLYFFYVQHDNASILNPTPLCQFLQVLSA